MPLRNISSLFKEHIGEEATTLAICWKIVSVGGDVFCFTNHDSSLLIDEELYKPLNMVSTSAIQHTTDMNSDNLEIEMVLDSDTISVDDLNYGLYDNASCDIFIVNYNNLSMGKVILLKGQFGAVTMEDDEKAKIELRGLTHKLQQTIGRQFLNTCDAVLGDSRCGIDLSEMMYSGTVTAVTDRRVFRDSGLVGFEEDYFRYGSITWLSGNNVGQTMEVKHFVSNIPIVAVNLNENKIGVGGDQSGDILSGDSVEIIDSDGNNGTYQVTDSVFYGGEYGQVELVEITTHSGFPPNPQTNIANIQKMYNDRLIVNGNPFNLMSAGDYPEYVNSSGEPMPEDYEPSLFNRAEPVTDQLRDSVVVITDTYQNDGTYVIGEAYYSPMGEYTVLKLTTNLLPAVYQGVTYLTLTESLSSNSVSGAISSGPEGRFLLFMPMPKEIQVGDTFEAIPGCDKKKSTCKTRFDNLINFRGFDFIPGRDKITWYPNAH